MCTSQFCMIHCDGGNSGSLLCHSFWVHCPVRAFLLHRQECSSRQAMLQCMFNISLSASVFVLCNQHCFVLQQPADSLSSWQNGRGGQDHQRSQRCAEIKPQTQNCRIPTRNPFINSMPLQRSFGLFSRARVIWPLGNDRSFSNVPQMCRNRWDVQFYFNFHGNSVSPVSRHRKEQALGIGPLAPTQQHTPGGEDHHRAAGRHTAFVVSTGAGTLLAASKQLVCPRHAQQLVMHCKRRCGSVAIPSSPVHGFSLTRHQAATTLNPSNNSTRLCQQLPRQWRKQRAKVLSRWASACRPGWRPPQVPRLPTSGAPLPTGALWSRCAAGCTLHFHVAVAAAAAAAGGHGDDTSAPSLLPWIAALTNPTSIRASLSPAGTCRHAEDTRHHLPKHDGRCVACVGGCFGAVGTGQPRSFVQHAVRRSGFPAPSLTNTTCFFPGPTPPIPFKSHTISLMNVHRQPCASTAASSCGSRGWCSPATTSSWRATRATRPCS